MLTNEQIRSIKPGQWVMVQFDDQPKPVACLVLGVPVIPHNKKNLQNCLFYLMIPGSSWNRSYEASIFVELGNMAQPDFSKPVEKPVMPVEDEDDGNREDDERLAHWVDFIGNWKECHPCITVEVDPPVGDTLTIRFTSGWLNGKNKDLRVSLAKKLIKHSAQSRPEFKLHYCMINPDENTITLSLAK